VTGAGSGWKARQTPRSKSRRQAQRKTSGNGVVSKRHVVQTGRPKLVRMKDSSPIFVRKLETAQQYSVTSIGAENIKVITSWLDMGYIEVLDHFLEWPGMNQQLGIIFGGKYAEDRRALVVRILVEHKQYLIGIEREKHRVHRESTRSKKGNKPLTVRRQPRTAS
jgi:hypothetical protein